MFNRYFNDELRDLRELGKAFARKHPEAGRLLEEFAYDPDVERVLEGVAFLTGRIRQKLDDEIPELSHGLLQLLWPHYLRPTPSMSVLEFAHRAGMVKGVQRIERGVQVASVPRDGTPCMFRTTSDVWLAPMRVAGIRVAHPTAGSTTLVVELAIEDGASIGPSDLPFLRFYLHGQRAVSTLLYYWLLRKTRAIVVASTDGGGTRREWPLPPDSVRPAGWSHAETLLDYGANVSRGYQILQEYFTLPEKYLFVDVCNLDAAPRAFGGSLVELTFYLEEDIPVHARPEKENLRLHCSPIVNLFPSSARPIRIDPLQHEYRVQVDESPPEHYEIYAIEEVMSFARGTAERRRYLSIFDIEDPMGEASSTPSAYMVHLKPAVVGEREAVDTCISLANPYEGVTSTRQPGEEEANDAPEYLSIDVTATNRHLPESLQVGDVCRPTHSSPSFATFGNLLRPTFNAPPPLERGLLWHLISLLNLNILSLGDVRALRSLLRAYQFAARHDRGRARYHQKLLAGLEEVRIRPREALYRGQVVRGTAMELMVRESMFEGEGDIFLFGSILVAFLRTCCSINTFVALTVTGVEQGLKLEWPVEIGRESLV